MNDYDEFEATMQAAGWSLDRIEAAWQQEIFARFLEEQISLGAAPAIRTNQTARELAGRS